MTPLEELLGKRRLFELLEIVDRHDSIYIAQLLKMGWNTMTATTTFRFLVNNGLAICTVEGGLGERTRKVYRLTPKGHKVLEHVREIQKLLNGRLGNK